MVTNSYHGLYYEVFEMNRRKYGVIFWTNTVITYMYIFYGTFIMIKYSFQMPRNEKKQSIFLIVAVIAPFVANILHVFKIFNINFDVTPITFSFSLLILTIATFRYRLLNAIPAGLRKVFDTVDASIILIDNTGVIVSKNNSFLETFSDYNGNTVVEFLTYLEERIINNKHVNLLMQAMVKGTLEPVFGEVKIISPKKKTLRIAIQPLLDNLKREFGRVISFTDITSYRELAEEFAEKNGQLIEANKQLRQHMLVVEELAVTKERNRLARDIHDSLGHTLTFLLKIQEGAILDFGSSNDKMFEAIKTANKITRQGLQELRLSLYDIMPERTGADTLLEKLERLTFDFKSSDVNIEITNECKDNSIDVEISQTVFRICQEAVTNSIKHGVANEIHIIIMLDSGILKLFIIDNGKGCIEIRKGYGLSGMEERVRKHKGNIIFGSDGESGFNIRLEIPIGGV